MPPKLPNLVKSWQKLKDKRTKLLASMKKCHRIRPVLSRTNLILNNYRRTHNNRYQELASLISSRKELVSLTSSRQVLHLKEEDSLEDSLLLKEEDSLALISMRSQVSCKRSSLALGKTPLDLALAILVLQTKQDVDWASLVLQTKQDVVGTVLGLNFEDVEEQISELKVLAADKEEIKELELTKEQDMEEVVAADVEVARQRNECRSS